MSVDREFRVRVSTVSDVSGARQTRDALTEVGKAGQEAQQKVRQETEKVLSSQQQFKQAIQGLTMEYPALAQVARLVLNPITAAVAGVTSAFSIWNWRMRESQQVLAGLELASAPALDPDRIGAATKAWQGYASAIDRVQAGLASVESKADRAMELLEARIRREKELADARAQASGGDDPYREIDEMVAERGASLQSRQAVLDAKRQEAAELEADAAAKAARAAGIRAGSAEDESALAKTHETNEKAAQEARAKAIERLADLRAYRSGEMPPWKTWLYSFQYTSRYDYASPDEAIAQEEQNIASADNAIAQARKFRRGSVFRGQARDLRSRLYEQAGGQQEKAAALRFGAETGQQVLNEDAVAAVELNRLGAIDKLNAAIKDSEREEEQLRQKAVQAIQGGKAARDSISQALTNIINEQQQLRGDMKRLEGAMRGLR